MMLQRYDTLDPDFRGFNQRIEFDVVVGFDPEEKQFAVVSKSEQ